MGYTESDLIVLAKRYNNTKRSYLLVDPLQGKHLAVSPASSLEMMRCLGKKISETCDYKLVIGFAETATAIAAVVAECMGDDCYYINTTRERNVAGDRFIDFDEDHSHAVNQKLCIDHLDEIIAESNGIIIVDDEFTTGKTLIHLVDQLAKNIPAIKNKEIIACSIINRISEENERLLSLRHIRVVSLLKITEDRFEESVKKYEVSEPVTGTKCSESKHADIHMFSTQMLNPRNILRIGDYRKTIDSLLPIIETSLNDKLKTQSRVLLLGTEECMIPALYLGYLLEEKYKQCRFLSHATTRSPIGVCSQADYPIRDGYKVNSFYEEERDTYIYNAKNYDAAVIVSDTTNSSLEAFSKIQNVLTAHGCNNFVYINNCPEKE